MLPRNLNVIANIWEREKSIRTIVLRPKALYRPVFNSNYAICNIFDFRKISFLPYALILSSEK
jgi:hypothetical protein